MNKHLLFLLVFFCFFIGVNSAGATNYYWWQKTSTDWGTASNWSTSSTAYVASSVVPGASDVANFVTKPALASYAVNLAGSYSVATLNITIPGKVLAMTMTTGHGYLLTINGTNQPVQIQATATINISNCNIAMTGAISPPYYGLYNSGTLGITSSTISFSGNSNDLYNTATCTITGGSTLNFTGISSSLINSSNCTITGSTLGFSGSNAYISNSSATATGLTIQTSSNISISYGGVFQNTGNLTVSGSSVKFTYNGLVSVGSPQANFSNTNSGIATIKSSSVFNFDDDCYLANAGAFTINGSTFELTGNSSYLDNTSTFNATSTTFAPSATSSTSGALGDNSYIQNDGIFNSTTSTFTFSAPFSSPTNGVITNTSNGTFTDNGSTFNLSATLPSDYSNNSLYNDGIFYAYGSLLNFSQVGGTASYANLYNDATFILGPTSITTLSATGSQIDNDDSGGPSYFLLQSDGTGTATIAQIASGSIGFTQDGPYYVQRYIQPTSTGTRGYRALSSPVHSINSTAVPYYTDLNYIDDNPATNGALNGTTINGVTYYGIATGGMGGNASGLTIINDNPTVYVYDESITGTSGSASDFYNGKNVGITALTAGSVSYSNINVTPTTGSVYIYAGTGYLAYYVGPAGPTNTNYSTHSTTASPTTITYSGQINQFSVPAYTFAPGGTSSSTLSDVLTGINMVGNPYPAPIDLVTVANDNTSLGTSVVFYELDDAHNFDAYSVVGGTGMSSGGASSEYIASGQGFYVTATGTGQSLTFSEDQKTAVVVPATSFLAKTVNVAVASSKLVAPSNVDNAKAVLQNPANKFAGLHVMLVKSDSSYSKSCGIYFNSNWNDTFDHNDAKDLDGFSPEVYMSSYTSDGTRVSINALGNYTKGKTVKLYVNASASGSFNLNLTDFANIDTSLFNIILFDHLLKDSSDVVKNKSYNFSINTADTTSFGANRFALSIERKPLPPYQLLSFTATKMNAAIAVNWKTKNEGDYTSFGLQKIDNGSGKFVTIDSLQSRSLGSYPFADPNPVTGTNTYRLSQNNVDGVVSYSDAVTVIYNVSPNGGLLNVYPNPTLDNSITVNFSGVTSANGETYNVSIYNSTGMLLMHTNTNSSSLTQDVSSLKPGTYIIEIKTNYGNSIGNAKFVKDR